MGGITKNRYYCATYSSNLTINCCYFCANWGVCVGCWWSINNRWWDTNNGVGECANYVVYGAQTMAGINSRWWDTNNGEGYGNNCGGECAKYVVYGTQTTAEENNDGGECS